MKTHEDLIRYASARLIDQGDLTVIPEVFTEGYVAHSWHRILRGTQQQALRGIPASGKRLKWSELVVSRFDGLKIAEEWLVSELAGEMMIRLKTK